MPPKVVLDPNVVVPAHLNEVGFEASVLTLALALCASELILAEYELVLHREKFRLNPPYVDRLLRLIRARAVNPLHTFSVASDPADNRFLECAEEAKADFLITGNKRHFPERWKSTQAVNAKELIEIVMPGHRWPHTRKN